MLTAGCFRIKNFNEILIGIAIPVRLGSLRLPNKPLIKFFGIEMIEHVRRRAVLSKKYPVVVVAADELVYELIENYGGSVLKSELMHSNGLSRIGEISETLGWRHYLVLQGDEILFLPADLALFEEKISADPSVRICNAISPINKIEDLYDESIVKCTLTVEGLIQTIFRTIPFSNTVNILAENLIWKICGVFTIERELLRIVANRKPTPIENRESIEQMRLLEMGYQIHTVKIETSYPSVNLQSDIALVNDALNSESKQAEILSQILIM